MSTNISKQKREELLREIGEIRNKLKENADENTNKLLVYLSNIEKDIDGKKYGLVFEEHREAVDELLENNVPVLIEDESLKIDNGGEQNFLIEGDNLASLKLLEKTHKGKIDLIYIDPPYNTGNKDFIYDDAFVDSEDKFKHSKWCSFITKRLNIAKKLLSNKGFIAISIDDNEYQSLRLLCDDIFGEENYLTTFHVQVRYAEKSINEEKPFKPLMEYVLFFAKDISVFNPKRETVEYGLDNFCYKITEISNGTLNKCNNQEFIVFKPNEWKIEKIEGCLEGLKETWITGSIYTTMSYGKVFQTIVEPRIHIDGLGCLYKVLGRGEDGLGFRYYTGPAREGATKGKMYSGIPLEKKEEFISGKVPLRKLPILTMYDFAPDFGNIRSEGGVPFSSGKKPVKMLKQIINYHVKSDSVVLDFFAGSGSTGHAVMKLNAEDGGNRKFILCTNNENNICRDVTYERIKRVIDKEKYKASLKYMKVGFEPISDKVYYEYADKLLLHVKELVELENGLDFENNKKVAITLTDEDLTAFVNGLEEKTTYKAVYVGHDVFVSPTAEEKLKSLEIAINRIPDYYYSELRG